MSHLLAAFAILAAAITGVAGFAISRRATSLERRAYELRMALADCSSAEERSAVAAAFEASFPTAKGIIEATRPTDPERLPRAARALRRSLDEASRVIGAPKLADIQAETKGHREGEHRDLRALKRRLQQ